MTYEERQARTKDFLKLILSAQADVPELTEMAGALVKAFGGAEEFAREYFTTYSNPTTQRSPMAKAKMLDGVLRIVQQSGSKKKSNPLEGMSDEDLEAVIDGILNQ